VAGAAGVSSGPAQGAAASCQLRGGLLPDPVCTPGVSDQAVTETNIDATICVRGYTAKVRAARAPYSYTRVVKRDRMAAYGYAGRPYSEFELDHLIPLELGGDPHAVGNLWVEFNDRRSGNSKDALENRMNALVCAGRLPLAQARVEIAADWVAAYRRYLG